MRNRCLFLLAAIAAVAANPTGEEFSHQFRNGIDTPFLWLSGPAADEMAKPDGQGLRITLPSTRKHKSGNISVSPTFALRGDCEVTLGYDLLSTEDPISPNTGAGIVLMVDVGDNESRGVALSRLRWPGKDNKGKDGKDKDGKDKDGKGNTDTFGASLIKREVGGKENYDTKRVPATAQSGYLRLERKSGVMKVLVADGTKDKFQLIREFPVGTDDLHSLTVQCRAASGGLDVRLVDLTIHADSFIDETAADSSQGRFGWVKWIIVPAVLVGGIGWFLHRRSRTKQPIQSQSVQEGNSALSDDKVENGKVQGGKAINRKVDNN